MQVSNQIKKAIISCAKHNYLARKNEELIVKWLEKNNLTPETTDNTTRDVTNLFVNSCIINNNPNSLIEELEKLN